MSYTLRDLPLPVKIVASVFLMAVGIGYGSAMVQLHLQDSKSGQPLPTVDDVIRKFTGKVKFDPNNPPPKPVSTFVRLASAPRNGTFSSSGTMSPAFFEKDNGEWRKACANAADQARVQREREGEQTVAILWAESPPDVREKAYIDNQFVPTDPNHAPKEITSRFKNAADGSFQIKSIIDERCARCHKPNGEDPDAANYRLDEYSKIAEKYLGGPNAANAPDANGYIKVEEPIGITKLTQSTHAHLLSFATLFSLTGVIFAFSSYPKFIRCILGPWVVLAVFADVSLWWLARLSNEMGPTFAKGIVVTGGLAGTGVALQITLSLFNMYGWKGKIVLLLLFGLGAALAGAVWKEKIEPELNKPKVAAPAPKPDAPKENNNGNGTDPKNGNGNTSAALNDDKKYPLPPLTRLDQMLAYPVRDAKGQPKAHKDIPFDGGDEGNMSRAFFDKEKFFKETMANEKIPQADKDKLVAEREGELRAIVHWARSQEPARKQAYDTDGFPLPADLGRPVTEKYLKDGKVLVKTIIADRCLKCHGEDKGTPLNDYAALEEKLKPLAPAAPVKPAEQIPLAKDE